MGPPPLAERSVRWWAGGVRRAPGIAFVLLAAAACGGGPAGTATSPPAATAPPTPTTATTALPTTTAPVVTAAPATTAPPAPATGPGAGSCFPAYADLVSLLTVAGAGESSLVVADFTGDGYQDVLIQRWRFATTESFPLAVLVNDTRGGLIEGTADVFDGAVPSTTFVGGGREVVADFNGDGRPDVFLPDFGKDAVPFPGGQNVLLLSTPDGRLADATDRLPQRRDTTHSAAAGDVDGDGDLDLYVGNIWGRDVAPAVLLNDGAGWFTPSPGALPPMTGLTQNGYTVGAFADVDGDGDADLVLGDAGDDIDNEHSTRRSAVLLNDGAGRFEPLPGAMPPGPFPSTPYQIALHIAAADLDHDGDLDLVVNHTRDYVGRMIQVLVNDGGGIFEDETAARLPQADDHGPWLAHMDLLDIDRDGEPDIVAGALDPSGGGPLVYRNLGGGFFDPDPVHIPTDWLYYAFIDLEADGGLDLVVSTFEERPPATILVRRDTGCLAP